MGSWRLRLRDGRFEFSDQFCRILGVTCGEVGDDFESAVLRFVVPDDFGPVWASVENGRKTGFVDLQFRILRKDGCERVVFVRGQLTPDSQDDPTLAGMLVDIPDKKKAQEQILSLDRTLKIACRIGRLGGWALTQSVRDSECEQVPLFTGEARELLGLGPEDSLTFAERLGRFQPDSSRDLAAAVNHCFEGGGRRSISPSSFCPQREWFSGFD